MRKKGGFRYSYFLRAQRPIFYRKIFSCDVAYPVPDESLDAWSLSVNLGGAALHLAPRNTHTRKYSKRERICVIKTVGLEAIWKFVLTLPWRSNARQNCLQDLLKVASPARRAGAKGEVWWGCGCDIITLLGDDRLRRRRLIPGCKPRGADLVKSVQKLKCQSHFLRCSAPRCISEC